MMIVMTIDLKRVQMLLSSCSEIDDNCDGTTDENAADAIVYYDDWTEMGLEIRKFYEVAQS